jgi:hypothetical protein
MADIALGVGVAGIVGAVAWAWIAGSRGQETSSQWRFEVRAVAGGMKAMLAATY